MIVSQKILTFVISTKLELTILIRKLIPVFFIGLTLLGLSIFSCSDSGKSYGKRDLKNQKFADLTGIRARGKLIAVTDFNAIDYFIYRGEPMGYQYDLLHELSKFLKLDLEIIVENDLEKSFSMLDQGKCDLLALNLTVTKERSVKYQFTIPTSHTRQVLVQRRPPKWWVMHPEVLEKSMLRNQLDLAGKTIYVPQNSSYASRLHNLSEEIGDSIHIIEMEDDFESLISKVSHGEIDFTICDENLAKVNQAYFRNIDIKTAISFPQNLAWALRRNNTRQLLDTLDLWLIRFKRTTAYGLIYNKYFKNQKSGRMPGSGLIYTENGTLSPFDNLLQRLSDSIDWDWRLLASLVYQESMFHPDTVSWAGAMGLMQLMPATAKRYGVNRNASPQENLEAGIKYIQWLEKMFVNKVPDPSERIKFVLASYNAGPGHILDARSLARKYGKNPEIWSGNVAEFILKKSNPKYYLDPVVKFGYLRGHETFNYVQDILGRYKDYKNIIALN